MSGNNIIKRRKVLKSVGGAVGAGVTMTTAAGAESNDDHEDEEVEPDFHDCDPGEMVVEEPATVYESCWGTGTDSKVPRGQCVEIVDSCPFPIPRVTIDVGGSEYIVSESNLEEV